MPRVLALHLCLIALHLGCSETVTTSQSPHDAQVMGSLSGWPVLNLLVQRDPFPQPIPAEGARVVAVSAGGDEVRAVTDREGRVRLDLSRGLAPWTIACQADGYIPLTLARVRGEIGATLTLVNSNGRSPLREVSVRGTVEGVDLRSSDASASSLSTLSAVELNGAFQGTSYWVPDRPAPVPVAVLTFSRPARELTNGAIGDFSVPQDGIVRPTIVLPTPTRRVFSRSFIITIPSSGQLLATEDGSAAMLGRGGVKRFARIFGDQVDASGMTVGNTSAAGEPSRILLRVEHFDGDMAPDVVSYSTSSFRASLNTRVWIRDWTTRERFDVPNIRALSVQGNSWTSARVVADLDSFDTLEVTVASDQGNIVWQVLSPLNVGASALPLPALPSGVTWRDLGVTDTVSVRVSAILRGPPFAAPWSRPDRSAAVRVTTLPVSLAVRDP